jgi:ABC-2 type transport system permease protein
VSGLSRVSPAAEPAVRDHRISSVAPSAFGDDFRRFVNLTWTLAVTDFKLRYFGSVLGYVWSLVRPLLFFGVLYFVFTQVFNLGAGVYGYPLYLLTGIMFWTFFAEATTGCVTCLVAREGLLRKMRFPRLVIPVAVVLTALFNLATNFVAVLVFAVASGHMPRLTWLEMPVLVALLAVLAFGVGMVLSVLYVRFRDIAPIWDVTAQILFYITPIIWPLSKLSPSQHLLQHIVVSNPLGMIQVQMYKAFINPSAPSAIEAIGGGIRILLPLGVIVIMFVLGVWLFNREAPRIAENL